MSHILIFTRTLPSVRLYSFNDGKSLLNFPCKYGPFGGKLRHRDNPHGGCHMKISMIVIFTVTVALAISIFSSPVWASDQKDLQKFYSTHSCRDCDLSFLNLSNAIFPGLDVKGANMRGAVLAYGKFTGSNFRKVDFTEANLTYANFSGADLRKADLTKATIAGADFTGAIWINGKRCLQGSIGMCKQ